MSLDRQYRVAKARGFNQAVRRIRELAPYSRDPQQCIALADLLAAIGVEVPALIPAPEGRAVRVQPLDVACPEVRCARPPGLPCRNLSTSWPQDCHPHESRRTAARELSAPPAARETEK